MKPRQKTVALFSLVLVVLSALPWIAIAGPGEDANAVIDRWSAAYNTNDPDAARSRRISNSRRRAKASSSESKHGSIWMRFAGSAIELRTELVTLPSMRVVSLL